MGTLFNIIGFGDTVERLFANSENLDDKTLYRATQYVSRMEANLGGTNILAPLEEILDAPIRQGFPRQVFCLTDGEVDNTTEVLEFVRESVAKNPDSRVFTFGNNSL